MVSSIYDQFKHKSNKLTILKLIAYWQVLIWLKGFYAAPLLLNAGKLPVRVPLGCLVRGMAFLPGVPERLYPICRFCLGNLLFCICTSEMPGVLCRAPGQRPDGSSAFSNVATAASRKKTLTHRLTSKKITACKMLIYKRL
jgi:hypothetical protein